MTSNTSTPAGHIRLIDDRHLGRDQVIATYLLLGSEPALVDPGPTSTLETLEAGLGDLGMGLGDLRAVLLTHIHLDHAGATGSILARYPHLQVYVHERGAPHLINPQKLLASATRLYGDLMDVLWGDFLPVSASNVVALQGGEAIRLGEHSVNVVYAPGHASHHVVYHEQSGGAAFVGDVGGVRLPGSTYARPATPPPDIDLGAWNHTLDQLRARDPRLLCLTHFGAAHDPAAHIDSYRERLARWAEVVRAGIASGDGDDAQFAQLQAQAAAELGNDPEEAARYEQATPLFQSWQGLVRYWRKHLA